ncbi:MAG: HAD family hydrolase [Comamonadaceae bacterium]|nr:HAD family hydrolase [Comamonadaceae bacterium]
MATGDNEARGTARSRAQVGIDARRGSRVLPQRQGCDVIRELQARRPTRSAMVGDGVNDAPALAAGRRRHRHRQRHRRRRSRPPT